MAGTLIEVARGWAALGSGWAVIADSKEEAQLKYEEAERRHADIMARPDGKREDSVVDDGNALTS